MTRGTNPAAQPANADANSANPESRVSLPREFDRKLLLHGAAFSIFVKVHVYHGVIGLAMLSSRNCRSGT